MKKIVAIVSIMVLLGSVLLVPASRVLGQEDKPKEKYALYLEVMKKLESLTPSENLEVLMGTEKDSYILDEPFEARFQVSHDCYIVLMDIGAATGTDEDIVYGDITFLIPSYKLVDNKVEGGHVYSTLHDFSLPIKVAPPVGYETVNLFCSPEKLQLFDADFEKEGVYKITPEDTDKLEQLSERLDRLNQQEWAGSSVSFLIKDPKLGIRPLPRKFGALPPIGATGTTGKFFPPIGATGTTGKQKEQ